MQKIRVLGTCVAIGGIALLGGCVGVPADPYYSGGYSQPYYDNPVVVQPAPVYIEGGGYYESRRPYYGGRPYYDGGRPYYGRPGYPVARPVPVPVPVPARPGWGGGGRHSGGAAVAPPGVSPLPQYRSQPPRGDQKLYSSPDSKGQTPP